MIVLLSHRSETVPAIIALNAGFQDRESVRSQPTVLVTGQEVLAFLFEEGAAGHPHLA